MMVRPLTFRHALTKRCEFGKSRGRRLLEAQACPLRTPELGSPCGHETRAPLVVRKPEIDQIVLGRLPLPSWRKAAVHDVVVLRVERANRGARLHTEQKSAFDRVFGDQSV